MTTNYSFSHISSFLWFQSNFFRFFHNIFSDKYTYIFLFYLQAQPMHNAVIRSLNLSRRDGRLQGELRFTIPENLIIDLVQSQVVQNSSLPHQSSTSIHQASHSKREISRDLIKNKNSRNRDHQQNHQINRHQAQRHPRRATQFEQHQRERTRDRVNASSRTVVNRPNFNTLQRRLSANGRLFPLSFNPKFNESDHIYANYRQCYSLRGSSHPGFMIVNDFSCRQGSSYMDFEITLPNPIEDDCGIGITYDPRDLVRLRLNNPIKRCMTYYFSRQSFRVAGSTYEPVSIGHTAGNIYRIIIDITTKHFIIKKRDQQRIPIRKIIPAEFLNHSIYIFLELKNSGKIKIHS